MSKTFCTSLYNKYIVYFYLNTFCLSCLQFCTDSTLSFNKNKSGYVVESWALSAPRSQSVASSDCVLSSPKALGVVWCPFSVHCDVWLPVSHRLSDTKTSDRARSVNTTVQTHPLPVTQTALKGRGRWHSMYSTADTSDSSPLQRREWPNLILVLCNS